MRTGARVQVLDEEGTWRAAGHGAIGAVLLGNVLLNYWLCVTTSPGYATDMTAVVSTACYGVPDKDIMSQPTAG